MLTRFTILFILICFALPAFAQVNISGIVASENGEPIEGVYVRLQTSPYETITNANGAFLFEALPLPEGFLFSLNYEHVAYDIPADTFTVKSLEQSITFSPIAFSKYYQLQEVPIIVPAKVNAPFHTEQLTASDIQPQNLGQDLNFMLRRTTSAVVNSDAGTGFGYTGLRIRGSDATRTNVTINGVALNDAESQGTFLVNLPNLAGQAQQINIQRGVGNSTNGSGAFGAGIHINTLARKAPEPYVEMEGSVGSFDTWRTGLGLGGKLPNGRLSADVRLSLAESGGFIDRASAELRSAMGNISYWGANSSLHLVGLFGQQQTYQAWFGVPAQFVNDDELRTFNPAGQKADGSFHDNQVDDYEQSHLQLHWQKNLAQATTLHLVGHYTRGQGFFEEFIEKTAQFGDDAQFSFYGLPAPVINGDTFQESNMIRRRWLDNHFMGMVANLDVDVEWASLSIGGAANHYIGNHFGELIESEVPTETDLPTRYYDADADKTDANVFVKMNIPLEEGWFAFADLQYRFVDYNWETIDLSVSSNNRYHFFNPKVGLSYKPDVNDRYYLSYGQANREPSRFDFLASPIEQPSSERLHDIELGYDYVSKDALININTFFMIYNDQLVPTGAINIDALPIRTNVENSYRIGIELTAEKQWNSRIRTSGAFAWSRNRIDTYEETVANFSTGQNELIIHTNTPIAFSPDVVAHLDVAYTLIDQTDQSLSLAFLPKYVSKQYIDNTGNEATTLDAYFFGDLRLNYEIQPAFAESLAVTFLLRNIWDAQFETNAWTSRYISPGFDPRASDPYAQLESGDTYNSTGFFPQAGINFLAGVTLRF